MDIAANLDRVATAVGCSRSDVRAMVATDRGGLDWTVEVRQALRPEVARSRKSVWSGEGTGPTLAAACDMAIDRIRLAAANGLFRVVSRPKAAPPGSPFHSSEFR